MVLAPDMQPPQRKRKRRITAAVAVASLPLQMMKEILCRLSAKDVLRYRSVCKDWRSLIDGPDFIATHLNRSKLGVLINGDDSLQLLRIDLEEEEVLSSSPPERFTHPFDQDTGRTIAVLGCCNGLLLVGFSTDTEEQGMAIWNPSTRKCTTLSYNTDSIYKSQVIGFGYDPVNDDYKLLTSTIISLARGGGGEYILELRSCCYEYQLYSLKAKTWKTLDKGFHDNYGYQYGHALVSNALHWIVIPKLEQLGRDSSPPLSTFIFAFDLVTETGRRLSMPNLVIEGEKPCTYHRLVELGGSLCVVSGYRGIPPDCHFDIWIMKGDNTTMPWVKLFSLVPSNVGTHYLSSLLPLTYNTTGDQVLLAINFRTLIVYDLRTRTAKDVRISGVGECFNACMCVSSLVNWN
ncbi:F-box domain containing protein [Trema orientale]|uniref:F-box domain containing protein n=1 Tax=Trema orientale TaxID=63057 RepID=A0A2P5FP89_TREOI|nr:F-box domain containing protein [Trema orientale]